VQLPDHDFCFCQLGGVNGGTVFSEIPEKAMKTNEATLNRPDGDRVIDAPYVMVDIDGRIDQLKDEKAWDENDRNGITLVKNDKQTIVLTCLHDGAEIKDNSVDGILTIQVLKGSVEVTTEVDHFELHKRSLITFRQNIVHSVRSNGKSVLLLTTVL
jgi:quercetin dioxygenase-like cupin family protein